MGEVCIGKGGFQVYGWQEAVLIGWGSSNLCSLVGWIGKTGGQYIHYEGWK
nr:hypothetical protein Iba_chr12bCG19340 [Ipomoea batatas]GMD70907.1 hypothetical protein Iba_chr12eCG10880 [Ipomoea batatas]